MAIYHFSVKVISRASGRSGVAAAAYRSASRLHDERLDRDHDFTNKSGVVHSEILLPDGAPERFSDRERLWNDVEATEKRKDAQLAREVEFAIPREMTEAQGNELARDFAQREFVDRGMIADLNVHWDIGLDGQPTPHAHVMLTMREVGPDGFGAKERDWNRTELVEQWRERWAEHANRRLAELDIDARIDHRSLEAQGIELEPQHKIGPAAARMAAQELSSERVDEHVEIARSNGDRIIANPGIALDAITHHQATFTTRDLAMIVHRHSDGKEQFDSVMAAVKAAPDLVALGKDGRGDDRFTSCEMIETEQRLERSSDALAERAGHGLSTATVQRAVAAAESRGLFLGGEQKAALVHVTQAGDLANVVGYAGSGKSAMLGVARDAWERGGYRVIGAALSGIAAENLESGSGIPSRTIAAHEHGWARDRDLLSANDVLVIDEAGMVGSRQMERVIAEAEERGAKVVLVGDVEQLQAIEAGAAFRSLAERHGAVEITKVRRQRDHWQRDATRQFATGRTAEALDAYAQAGMVIDSPTRESAREALIERWDSDRIAEPASSAMILTHTNAECDELNDLARDRLKQHGTIATDIAVETGRGRRLFAVEDRVMFLKNDCGLGVKNGTLGTIEQIDSARMAVRLDDGRQARFDVKDYAHVTHGYAATIHKSQGVTVDRSYVLATPGLDRHAGYVALSRHRDGVQLHYGRDDFADAGKLARALSRDRPKDMALDYRSGKSRFAERRGVDPSHAVSVPERRPRSMFDGLRLAAPGAESAPARGTPSTSLRRAFDELQLPVAPERDPWAGLKLPAGPLPPIPPQANLDAAVQRYARAVQDIGRMTNEGYAPLEYQKISLAKAGEALDRVQPNAARDLGAAFAREPGLVSEAANGKTARALRALQLEAEVRINPELRADRFVEAWRELKGRAAKLSGWQNEDARGAVESRMRGMAKGLEQDPALGVALSKRGSELIGRQWSLEWSPGSRDGGIGRAMSDLARARSVAQALTESIGRGRDLGLSL